MKKPGGGAFLVLDVVIRCPEDNDKLEKKKKTNETREMRINALSSQYLGELVMSVTLRLMLMSMSRCCSSVYFRRYECIVCMSHFLDIRLLY